MNYRSLIYIKDFILIIGRQFHSQLYKGYITLKINPNTIILLKKSNVISHCSLKIDNETFLIQWYNSLYPLFEYKNKYLTIITPNYSNFYKLSLTLNLRASAIHEFIVFNTLLHKTTFHKEVKRIFYIKTITIGNERISYITAKNKSSDRLLTNTFNNIINYKIGNTNLDRHSIFLSGGNESRINAAISNFYNLNRKFITWGHPKNREFHIASKIAQKSKIQHVNIRPEVLQLPYREFLEKTGFLSNMQYAYRYQAVKMVFDEIGSDHLWTGWGDILGYLPLYKPTEFFNSIFWRYIKTKTLHAPFWDENFISSFELVNTVNLHHKSKKQLKKNILDFFYEEIAPRIYGQVLSAENTIGHIVAPWFNIELYEIISSLKEKYNSALYLKKYNFVLRKNSTYANLIAHYDSRLNFIVNSKNYYSFLFQDSIKYFGLPISYFLTKTSNKSDNSFDSIFNVHFIKKELFNVLDSNFHYFNKKEIQRLISNINVWSETPMMELFQIIQINWLLHNDEKCHKSINSL